MILERYFERFDKQRNDRSKIGEMNIRPLGTAKDIEEEILKAIAEKNRPAARTMLAELKRLTYIEASEFLKGRIMNGSEAMDKLIDTMVKQYKYSPLDDWMTKE